MSRTNTSRCRREATRTSEKSLGLQESLAASGLLCLLLALSLPVAAQENTKYDSFNDPFRFYVGGFIPSLSSTISINGDVVIPPPISIEDVLGVDDSESVPFAGMQWHISQRNSIEFEYFQLNRDGFVNLFPDPVEVGDLIIESGSINTAFDISIGRLTYGFSLMRSERSDLQIKGGLHIADFSIALQLSGAVCDVSMGEMPPCPTGQTPAAESEEVTAPLPHFGLSWGYALTPTISAKLQAIGFAIELDNIDGGLLEVDADIAWQPFEHFGFGLGFRYFNANVKATGTDLNGEFDLEYYGPVLFVQASF